MDVLGLLRAAAAGHFAREIAGGRDHVIFDVAPPSVSGAPSPTYRLRVEARSAYATVREASPTLLPAFCPERHINFEGFFCLYWAEVEPLTISDTEAASVWWMKVLTFLKRQQVATALRQWPAKSEARAHGQEAAQQQVIAEAVAHKLGPRFHKALLEDRLVSIRCTNSGEPRLRLLRDGSRLASVKERTRKLMTRRARCKCDDAEVRRLPICACADHEEALTSLTLALYARSKAERRFFEAYAATGRRCCGTMEDCPLAA
jgi:Prokaryotic E2 domain/Cysteine-rich domain, C-terminal to E2 domain